MDRSSASATAGAAIGAQLERYKGVPVLLLFSGGSALEIIESIPTEYLADTVTLAVVDERFSAELDINNFAQVQATRFYNATLEHGVYTIDTQPQGDETPEELAQRFEKGLLAWRRDFPYGIIIATLGVGADGHTAGILPMVDRDQFEKEYEGTAWTAVRAVTGQPFSHRITTTITFLKTIDHAHYFVFGREKDTALDAALSGDAPYAAVPARVIRDIAQVTLYTDASIPDAIL